MISIRTIGVFVIACAAICLTIAVERYYSAVQTAKAFAAQLEGIEFESVSVPKATIVCGLAGVVLLVAGIRLVIESFNQKTDQKVQDGLLKG